MKGGEAYDLPAPHPAFGGDRPARIDVYRAGRDGAQVRYLGADGHDRWAIVPLRGGIAPDGWRLAGLARPSGRLIDGEEVWHLPGGRSLIWAGPECPLVLHDAGARPGWLGPEAGAVAARCRALTEAQAAADAWWLAEVGRHVTLGQPGGQQSLFAEVS